MSAIATIDRPGVQVIQQFSTATPTVVTPALPANVLGPAFQVVEAVDDQGALVSSSLITQPARLTTTYVTTPFEYASIGTESLVLSINNGAAVTFTFPTGPNLTAAEVVDFINTQATPGLAARVEVSGTQQRVVLETTLTGENASLLVDPTTTAAVLTAFGFTAGNIDRGSSGYVNSQALRLQEVDYPDPRSNLAELDVDYDTVRVFINNGTNTLTEVSRTSTLLQGATSAVAVVDDGDGDNLSPFLSFASADFTASPAAAAATGNADLTGVTFPGDVQGRALVVSVDGGEFQTILFTASTTDAATLVSDINGVLGGSVASLNGNFLELTSPSSNGGIESSIQLDKVQSDATLLTTLGLTDTGSPFESLDLVRGTAFVPFVGDEVWVDGVRVGTITEIPAGTTDRLRLNVEQLLSFTGTTWYIRALGLDNSASTSTRPSTDLVVDDNTGTFTVKAGLFFDTAGVPTAVGPLATYVAYTALRLDVSPSGEEFNLLRFGTTTALSEALSPVDTQNPLGLGLFLAMLNAPGVEVTGLGVGDVSDSEPEGTLLAYTAGFEYLESKDVYAIAPLTQALAVGQVGQTHVSELSEPENGLERVLLFNPPRPTRQADTVVASSATGNVSGPPTDVVSTGIANLQALLAAAGTPGPTFTEADGVYLELENDTNKYLVQSVSGDQVTLNNGPLSASNTEFFDNAGSPIFTSIVVDRPHTVKILGGALGSLTDEAVAYGAIAQGFQDRRVVCTAPDTAVVTIDGLDTTVPGYYLNAALAGRMSAVFPQQGLTEDVLVGFQTVRGSQDRYGELQLKIMSGAGLWIFYQDGEAGTGPVRTRQQLTTDMSSVTTREDSIRRVLDFTSKTFRAALRTFIGQFNVTTAVQDAINSTLDGVGRFLVRLGVLLAFSVDNIRQSTSNPDELEVDVTVTVPVPLNRIRLTLIV
jgi:hypothetical protein